MADDDRVWNRRGLLGPGQRAYLERMTSAYAPLLWLGAGPDVRDDLARGQVAAVDGEVYFEPRDPRTRLGAWLFRAPAGTFEVRMAQSPLPGRHRAYVLPGARVVVGTEGDGPPHVAAYAAQLGSLMRVGPDDMAALRAGAIPASLRRRARRMPDAGEVAIGALMIVLGAIALGAAPLLWGQPKGGVPAALLGVAFLAFGYFFGPRTWVRVRRAADSGRVRVVQAPLVRDFTLKPMRLTLVFPGVALDVTRDEPLYRFVAEGVPHRAYFTEAGVLLALEPALP